MNDRLWYLKIGGDLEDALRNEVDQINSSPFIAERYAFWDDDRITAKKAAKQVDQLSKKIGQRNDK